METLQCDSGKWVSPLSSAVEAAQTALKWLVKKCVLPGFEAVVARVETGLQAALQLTNTSISSLARA
jgi:hypothetical protein